MPLLRGDISKTQFIWSNPAVYCRYRNGVDRIASLAQEAKIPKVRDMDVEVWFGAAGTGKTWKARTENEDSYEPLQFDNKGIWFDDYTAQSVLILDEFASADGARISANVLKRYLDVFPLQAPVKGGSIKAAWTKVIITSNTTPLQWYPAGADRDAVFDRISVVKQFVATARVNKRSERYKVTEIFSKELAQDDEGNWSLVDV